MLKIDLDQIGQGNDQFTCYSCEYSAYYPTPQGAGLWCQTHKRMANALCVSFFYCPGTDESER